MAWANGSTNQDTAWTTHDAWRSECHGNSWGDSRSASGHKTCQVCGMSQFICRRKYLPVTSSHYYTIGASDNNADCSGRCDTGWRDDDSNTVDPDSNSRWDNSR